MDYNGKDLKVYDSDYEIIFSGDFNIYGNELRIVGIKTDEVKDTTLIFRFVEDETKKASSISTEGDEATQTAHITLTNFRNPLGIASSKRIPIIVLDNKTTIFLSTHVKSVSSNNSLLKVSITLYKK